MKIKRATLDDLDEIMRVEKETFGDVGDEAMATREMMEKRIQMCNRAVRLGEKKKPTQWFWLAEKKGRVFGQMILQPTHLVPEECISWNQATDIGTFRNTFAEDGDTIFGASLSVTNDAPAGTAEFLLCKIGLLMMRTGKKRLMFCSRLPGLKKAVARGMSPEEYWQTEIKAGVPKDPLLQLFFRVFGAPSYSRLIPDGWGTDKKSLGYSALLAVEDAFFPLYTLVEEYGKRLGKDFDDSLAEKGEG